MVLFAARSMAFREGSRSKLVQVVVVHAGIVAATFMFTRDVAYAEAAYHLSVGMSSPMTHTFGSGVREVTCPPTGTNCPGFTCL